MGNKFLRQEQTATAGVPPVARPAVLIVAMAQDRAQQMLRWESRGPGDLDPAMGRLANRHCRLGLTKALLWALRYRPPKRIWGDALVAILAAYERERQRQLRALDASTNATAEALGPAHPAVRAGLAVLLAEVGVAEADDAISTDPE